PETCENFLYGFKPPSGRQNTWLSELSRPRLPCTGRRSALSPARRRRSGSIAQRALGGEADAPDDHARHGSLAHPSLRLTSCLRRFDAIWPLSYVRPRHPPKVAVHHRGSIPDRKSVV